MNVVVAVALGLFVGGFFLAGGVGFPAGALIGGLIGWCLHLEGRVASLERNRREPGPRSLAQRPAPRSVPPQSATALAPEAADRAHRGAATALTPPVDDTTPTDHSAQFTGAPARSPARRSGTGPATRRPAGPLRPDMTVTPETTSERAGVAPPVPSTPEWLVERARAWFTTGNVPVKVGVVLSLFGVAFLIKEAIDRSWLVLPIEIRLVGVATFGLILLGVGWRLRERRAGYGLSLQGGGVAVVYLTVYAAFGIYHLLPGVAAFSILVATTILAGVLAVRQNARALAVLGIIGGFLAPILASNGAGDHVVLFGYYAVLNAAIFGIAWRRAWRELNLLGFLFTFVIGSIWGYTAYRPEQFATTEPFLILFVLMYVAISIFFARLAPPVIRGFVDATLVFGVPLIAFGLQIGLIGDSRSGLAISAAVVAGFYGLLSAVLLSRGPAFLRVLGEAFAGLAIAFVAIAAPLALSADATSVAWAVQGGAMCWLGYRQNRRLALASGIALQGLAAAAYFAAGSTAVGLPAFLNGPVLGALVLALAAGWSSRIIDLTRPDLLGRFRGLLAGALLVWAVARWLAAGVNEIDRVMLQADELNGYLTLVAATVAAAAGVVWAIGWTRPAAIGALLVPALALGLPVVVFDLGHPLARDGWLVWTALLAAHLLWLRLAAGASPRLGRVLHAVGYAVFALAVIAEIHWQLARYLAGVWPESLALVLLGCAVAATAWLCDRLPWPFAAAREAYTIHAGGVLAALGIAAMIVGNAVSTGAAGPLPYIPLANPLELASVAYCFIVVRRLRRLADQSAAASIRSWLGPAAAGLGLYLLTTMLARSVHYFAGVPFDPEALAASAVFQSALAVAWGSAAFAGMIVGARRQLRFVWLAGAGLMGVVVMKLFLIDLASTGTVERVISFLGVGILLLVVGYFAPVPPRRTGPEADAAGDVV